MPEPASPAITHTATYPAKDPTCEKRKNVVALPESAKSIIGFRPKRSVSGPETRPETTLAIARDASPTPMSESGMPTKLAK
jgi:hypothetical protein